MSPEVLETTAAVIDALGGPVKVAEITGRKYTAAWNWTKAETFPSNTYLALQAALAATGKAAPPSLWGMTEPHIEAAQ